jgi:uncharacterized repeat protein (TIGR03803 family)
MTNHRQVLTSILSRDLRQKAFAASLACALIITCTQATLAQTFTLLYSFTGGADGGTPYGDLVMDAAGNLYGTTYVGGASGYGTVYMLNDSGNQAVLHSFTGRGDGANPKAGLTMDHAGNLYGTTTQGGRGFGTIFKLSRTGSNWILNTLYSFTGGNDGAAPSSGVIFGQDGGLYGTTGGGGSADDGAVYKLVPPATACKSVLCPWTETVLHSFTGGDDGMFPTGGLIQDAAGNLYGTTTYGGIPDTCGTFGFGCGTVFEYGAGGSYQVLYRFPPTGESGLWPYDGLLLDASGNLYGTANEGGDSQCVSDQGQYYSCGVIFKLDSTRNETVLYAFTGPGDGDGAFPYAALVRDSEGNFYVTTYQGGIAGGCGTGWGCGTVFEFDASGSPHVLYQFPTAGENGILPEATLLRGANGSLYGTADFGGINNSGTIFKLTP